MPSRLIDVIDGLTDVSENGRVIVSLSREGHNSPVRIDIVVLPLLPAEALRVTCYADSRGARSIDSDVILQTINDRISAFECVLRPGSLEEG